MYLANWEETAFLFFNVVTLFFVGLTTQAQGRVDCNHSAVAAFAMQYLINTELSSHEGTRCQFNGDRCAIKSSGGRMRPYV